MSARKPRKEAEPRCVGSNVSLARQPYAELVEGGPISSDNYCPCTISMPCFSQIVAERSSNLEILCPSRNCNYKSRKWRIHPVEINEKGRASRPAPIEHEVRFPTTEEDGKRLERMLRAVRTCRMPGCDRSKGPDEPEYCDDSDCRALGARLSAPPVGLGRKGDAASLKSVHAPGTRVVAAYWPPEDMDRRARPRWEPGVVTHAKERDGKQDAKYGPVRRYNVTYEVDGGDRLRGLGEHEVCEEGDHALRKLLGVLGARGERSHAAGSWRNVKGVRNVTDKKSKDLWAKNVGWYVATVDGRKQEFARLKDALLAVDTSTVRKKGLLAKRGDLYLPEEWRELFRKEEEELKAMEAAAKAAEEAEKAKEAEKEKQSKAPPAKRKSTNGAASSKKAKTWNESESESSEEVDYDDEDTGEEDYESSDEFMDEDENEEDDYDSDPSEEAPAKKKKRAGVVSVPRASAQSTPAGAADGATKDPEASLTVDQWLVSLASHLVVKLTLSLPPKKAGRMGVTLREDKATYGLPMIATLAPDSPLRGMIPPFVVKNYCLVSIEGEEEGIAAIRSVEDFTFELNERRKEEGESLQEVMLVTRRGQRPVQPTDPLYI